MSGPFAGSTAAVVPAPDSRKDIPRTRPTLTLPRRNGNVCHFACQERLCLSTTIHRYHGTQAALLIYLVCEGNVQAGGKHDVVFLRGDGGIGDVDVTELVLPAEPFADFCHGSEIKREA